MHENVGVMSLSFMIPEPVSNMTNSSADNSTSSDANSTSTNTTTRRWLEDYNEADLVFQRMAMATQTMRDREVLTVEKVYDGIDSMVSTAFPSRRMKEEVRPRQANVSNATSPSTAPAATVPETAPLNASNLSNSSIAVPAPRLKVSIIDCKFSNNRQNPSMNESIGLITAIGHNDIHIEDSEFSSSQFTRNQVCL